jgi:hypothetical protein
MTTKTFTGADRTLYHIAAREYSNALLWYIIAAANGLSDPVITGTMQLVIPPKPPSDNDGVPQQ